MHYYMVFAKKLEEVIQTPEKKDHHPIQKMMGSFLEVLIIYFCIDHTGCSCGRFNIEFK